MSTSHSDTDEFHELDVVQLTAESGRWPAGTEGTILEVFDSAALVEIDDDQGHTLELIEVPYGVLNHVPVYRQESLVST